ncbi:MAG: S24 family peptidase [Bryobacterales bacterium]|nr:S24 family peptidase [Bryobacterales bacterium]
MEPQGSEAPELAPDGPSGESGPAPHDPPHSHVALLRSFFSLLELHVPGESALPAGILLVDPSTNRLHLKITSKWPDSLQREDRAVLDSISREFTQRAAVEPGDSLIAEFEDSFSHLLRLSPRESIVFSRPERELAKLFDRHVERKRAVREAAAEVISFRTHLPFYPMKVAAGLFDGDQEIEAAAWIPIPDGVRPDETLFVARVTGKSMEPRIPDGSYCLFRSNPQGSREGKLVLVQRFGVSESGGAFTIKKYHSEKAPQSARDAEEFSDGEWRHSRVRLISLNPLYPSWDLREDECRILAG